MMVLIGLAATFVLLASTELSAIEAASRPALWILPGALTPLVGSGIAFAVRRLPCRLRRRLERSFYLAAYLLSYALILYPGGWAALVLLRLGWLGQPLSSHALLLVPAATLALWLAPWIYRAEMRLLPGHDGAGIRFARWLAGAVRVVVLAGAVFAVAIAGAQLVRSLADLETFFAVFPSAAALVGCAAILVMIVVFPVLLLLAWPTESMPPDARRAALEETAVRAGVALRDIRIWDRRTDLNACVIGHFAWNRYVLFTRGALERLSDADLTAVFSHELGHVSAGHLWRYLAFFLAFFLSLLPLHEALAARPAWVQGLSVVAYSALVWGVLFGYVSRRVELEADVIGAGLAGEDRYLAAMTRIWCYIGARAAWRDSWRYFSLSRRAEHVAAASADPAAREALARMFRRARRACASFVVVAVAAYLWSAERDVSRPAAHLALERAVVALDRADQLARVLEARRGDAPTAPWAARDGAAIVREYAASLRRAEAGLERYQSGGAPEAADEESAGSVAERLEHHRTRAGPVRLRH